MPETPEKAAFPENDRKSLDTEPTSGKSASGEGELSLKEGFGKMPVKPFFLPLP